MKKIALVILAGISIGSAKAQIQYGVKAGANFASMKIHPSVDGLSLGSKTDFNGGVFVGIPLVAGLSIQPEAYYSGEGSKVSGEGTGKYNLGYIDVPVLVKYKHETGLFAETGPQIGFLLSAKAKADGGQSEDVKSSFKSTNFGWAFGVGYQLPVLPLGIDVRYNLGLSNIASGATDGSSLKTTTFQVGLFYAFSGGKK